MNWTQKLKRVSWCTGVLLILAACAQPTTAPTATPAATSTPAPSPIVETSKPAASKLRAETKIDSRTGTAYGLAFSPDGESIAVASGYELSILSADLQDTRAVVAPPGIALINVTWRPDGQQLATVEGFRHPLARVWSWDAAQQQIISATQFSGEADLYGVSWSPTGQTLVTLADDDTSTIQVWRTAEWEKEGTLELPYTNPRRALDWNPDGTRLYEAGEANGEAVIFSVHLPDGAVTELLRLPINSVHVFAISPDAGRFAVANKAGLIRILDAATGEELIVLQGPAEPVDIDWSPDGDQLAVLSYRTALQLWDMSHSRS